MTDYHQVDVCRGTTRLMQFRRRRLRTRARLVDLSAPSRCLDRRLSLAVNVDLTLQHNMRQTTPMILCILLTL